MADEFDFATANTSNVPEGYPTVFVLDTYSREPFADFRRRKQIYLEYCAQNPARPTRKGFLYELARLALERPPVNVAAIEGALRYIDQRLDCSDFLLLGILRMMLQFGENPLLPQHIKESARQTILDFKYWPDEPGLDSMCTWTENHQVLFSTCEYLAGGMFPDSTFSNSGICGRQKMAKARPRLLRWMELRFRTGFNEWLSNVYYDEDIAALLTLADFCDDAHLVHGAFCILDLLFFDMALNSFRGTFGSSHGRSYWEQKKSGLNESTADTQKIAFGMGILGAKDNMSGIHLALNKNYDLPPVLERIASDAASEMLNRQRIGIKIGEARRWGLDFKNLDDLMTLLSFEAYTHPKTFRHFVRMLDAYNWWENDFLKLFGRMRRLLKRLDSLRLTGAVAWLLRKDVARNMREEVNVTTYRTPDYMLSASLDYKKGYGGDQHHIWQATLSEEAVCFTTHPGGRVEQTPNYWTGSGFLPRVAMYKNIVVAAYRIPSSQGLYVRNRYAFTHAYFPRDKFDAVSEKGGWIFGRKGNGYIALYSQNGYRWQTEGPDKDAEVIAEGKNNIWLCELGRGETHGSFTDFQRMFLDNVPKFRDLRVIYDSPSCGTVRFGWRGRFSVNGKHIALHDFGRYDNPYSTAQFDPGIIEIKSGKDWLHLELKDFQRRFGPAS